MKDIPTIAVILLALDIVLMSSVVSFAFLASSAPNSFLSKATLYAVDAAFYNQSGLKIDLSLGNSGTLGTSVTQVFVGTTLTNMQRLVINPVYLPAKAFENITIDYEWESGVAYFFRVDSAGGQCVVWPDTAPEELTQIPSPSVFLKVTNPLTNDDWFNFTSVDSSANGVFTVNIEVVNVTSLCSWQIRLNWDPSLMSFVNASVPEDVMLSQNFFLVAMDSSAPGRVLFGGLKSPGTGAFNGSCILIRVELRMTGNYGKSSLALGALGSDTFLLDNAGHDISFASVNGKYVYSDGFE